jgi:hypothetical protein
VFKGKIATVEILARPLHLELLLSNHSATLTSQQFNNLTWAEIGAYGVNA